MSAPTETSVSVCPRCTKSTVAIGLAQPWCPSCEWNLDQKTPVMFGWRWLDRRLNRIAARLTDAQFHNLADGPLQPRTITAARLTTLTAATLLLAGIAAVAAFGVWLIFFDFFSLSTILGAIVLGVAFMLRPRLGSRRDLEDHGLVLETGTTPNLAALTERVAAAVGAPVPQVLMLGYDLNAFTAAVGVRRTRILCIGLPLWATLEPQERVALLGHELSHFVNGDIRRGPLTQIAETTLARVAHLFSGGGTMGRGLMEHLAAVVTRFLTWLIRTTALILQLLLLWISLRDSQRAEYLADEMAARAAGTDAAVGLANYLVELTPIDTVVRREARARNGMPAWRDAARVARTNQAVNLPLLRQVSRHTQVSLYASHPPSGLRAEMLERRPRHTAAVTLTDAEAARIDEELAVHQKRVQRELTY